MTQRRAHSALEVCLNTASGFVLSLGVNWLLHLALGIPMTGSENVFIVTAFTIVSLVRSYFWRRLFNWLQHRPKKFIRAEDEAAYQFVQKHLDDLNRR